MSAIQNPLRIWSPRVLRWMTLVVALIGLIAWPIVADETKTAASKTGNANQVVKFEILPASAALNSARDRQSFVAQATFANGITRDVTAEVAWSLEHPNLAKMEQSVLYPLADRESKLIGDFQGQKITVPIKITGATTHPPISFKIDVMPVFMKAGCNAGSCHGAARGKDGFRLSLYGFDPDGDYHRITREFPGRRVNLAVPVDSLIIEKPTGAVSHTGGNAIKKDGANYQTLINWLQAGAVNDPGQVPTVTKVEIFPRGGVLDGAGATQQLSVRATYSDGTDRDVTSLAYFSSNNENSALVDQTGRITAAKRGEAFIMARFDTHTVGSPFIVLPKGLEFQWKDVAEYNYIDALVHAKLKNLRIQPSEICSDEQYARRIYLDICGVLPTPEDLKAFAADKNPKKREALVDRLLDRKEFVEIWVMKWSELLMIRSSQRVSYKSTLLYYNWLQSQVANNVPINQMVVDLLGAQGGTFAEPATNYYQAEQNPLKISENVAQVFMGMRIQCAQCHNHPFDRWTMDDYYSFASFFTQIGRKRGEDPRETIVFNRFGGEVNHPVRRRALPAKFLGGQAPDTSGKDRREVMAKWMASSENPYFARNLANIVWAHFLGRGIIDPVDDVRVSNPASNEALLAELAKRFTDYNYDFKRLVRDICTSRTYQLSTLTNATNESDRSNFSHAVHRRIRAEVLLDVVSQITETKNKFRGLPLGARAVQIADGNTTTYFLNAFGRARRESVCSCEVKSEPNLSQALHLLNGGTVQGKINAGNVVGKMIQAKMPPADIIRNLYARTLCRQPSEQELQALLAIVNAEANKKVALDDVFWALLNSREFVFNH